MTSLSCILFAGGKSSRMGEDKALLPFGGYDTLAEYQYRRLQKIFSQVYISTKDPHKFPFDAALIVDKSDVYAPTAGFVSIYDELDAERFFVLGVDMPFVDKSVIETLVRADRDDVDATLAMVDGRLESMCGIYHRSLQNEFEAMLQEDRHKLQMMLQKRKTLSIPFEEKTLFFNLNKPHEYQKAKELYDIIN